MPALHSVLFPNPISIAFKGFSWVLPPLVESEVPFVEHQCDDPPHTLDKSKEMELTGRILSVSCLFFLWFWSKIGNFPIFLLVGKIFYEKVFHDSLEKKIAFLGYKNEFEKVEKLGFFQRG